MQGYYRFPTIHDDSIVFTSEDDLWRVPAGGGTAVRLTAGLGTASYPRFSPDGKRIAFSGSHEGPDEVFVMPAEGGEPRRLTFLGSRVLVCGWDPEGNILFASPAHQPFGRPSDIFRISPDGGQPERLPVGPALTVSYGPGGGRVLGRYGMISREPAHWKRYKGGTAGDMWIDPDGKGEFHRLIRIDGNVTHPLWLGSRIYFVADHEGVGNLYSCDTDGSGLTRHTSHGDYYVRHPSTDGSRIVYHAGADLFVYDPETDSSARVNVAYPGPRTDRHRKFVPAARYLEEYGLHPEGHLLSLVTRGKPCVLGPFEGPATQYGETQGVRYRHADWLPDGALVMTSDSEGEVRLEVHQTGAVPEVKPYGELDIGNPWELKAAPVGRKVALSNHRNELLLVDLDASTVTVVDRSEHLFVVGFDWSPDGRWLAYAIRTTPHVMVIRIHSLETGSSRTVTRPVLQDWSPVFDPEGKYLYFISDRELNPVYDQIHFDLGFPQASKPYLLTLRKDVPSPFLPQPEPDKPGEGGEKKEGEATGGAAEKAAGAGKGDGGKKPPEPVQIDFDGIEDRTLAFPVDLGILVQIAALPGKLLYSVVQPEGALGRSWAGTGEPAAKAALNVFDFKTQESDTLVSGITSFALARNGKKLVYRAGNRIRVIPAGEKPKENGAGGSPRKTGWVDLDRVRVSVEPPAEWRQMYAEAWRLQRDNFWNAEMSGVEWRVVYDRYLPLLDRVSTRGEFSDLMWEMQGELGTSHAYEIGGDYRPSPRYGMGFLGADLSFDGKRWRIDRIYGGDTWTDAASSPLVRAGAGAAAGDTILAINGRPVDGRTSPWALLVNQAGAEIAVTLADRKGKNPRTVPVKTLSSETPARYREWVEANRRAVHEATNGRAGYVHIPDMGPGGYAEFHRSFLSEVDRDGLVIDVRYNSGGHVSSLLLEKLARRRVAYVATRWFGVQPYPDDSPAGPMVAITNESAGSDGDIFSHNFKLMKLGPLVGTRTWGGVVGIWPRQRFVDGGLTTQPEFSFWFRDVGWAVENYGTDPDIEVEITPQEFGAGKDPQLERALKEIRAQLARFAPELPDITTRATRELPRLDG